MKPHDGPAQVSVRVDAGKHNLVTRALVAHMLLEIAASTQSGSGGSYLGDGGIVG
jgi:hypothetical protein